MAQLCASGLQRRSAAVSCVWFCLAFAFESTDMFFIRYLHDTGRARLMQPCAQMQYACKLTGGGLGVLLVDRLGRKRMLMPAFLLAGTATWLLTLASDEVVLASVALYYAAAEVVWSTLKTFTVELFPTESRSSAIGLATAVGFAGSAVTLFIGPLLFAYADLALPFKINACVLACGALLVSRQRETARTPLMR